MKHFLIFGVLIALTISPLCRAQTTQPAPDDSRPASSNVPGAEYPRIHSPPCHFQLEPPRTALSKNLPTLVPVVRRRTAQTLRRVAGRVVGADSADRSTWAPMTNRSFPTLPLDSTPSEKAFRAANWKWSPTIRSPSAPPARCRSTRRPAIPRTRSTRCSISCTASAATRRNGSVLPRPTSSSTTCWPMERPRR